MAAKQTVGQARRLPGQAERLPYKGSFGSFWRSASTAQKHYFFIIRAIRVIRGLITLC